MQGLVGVLVEKVRFIEREVLNGILHLPGGARRVHLLHDDASGQSSQRGVC